MTDDDDADEAEEEKQLLAAIEEAFKSSADHRVFNPERFLEVLRELGYDVELQPTYVLAPSVRHLV